MTFTDAYRAALMVQILSLNARLREVQAFTYNTDMQIEAQLLRGQIATLESEFRGLTKSVFP